MVTMAINGDGANKGSRDASGRVCFPTKEAREMDVFAVLVVVLVMLLLLLVMLLIFLSLQGEMSDE
jgi:preprotein translocase subunit SecE